MSKELGYINKNGDFVKVEIDWKKVRKVISMANNQWRESGKTEQLEDWVAKAVALQMPNLVKKEY